MRNPTPEEGLEVEDERRARLVAALLHGSDRTASGSRPGPFGSLVAGIVLAVVVCLVVGMVILVQRDLASGSNPSRPAQSASPSP